MLGLSKLNYVSPHEMGRHIVFSSVVCLSVCLSIRLSVCPSHFRVRSISVEPLVGFTNNFAQMSSMMRGFAVPMFDQGRFKVKEQSKIKHCMTVFRVRSKSLEPLVGFTNNFAQISSVMRQCAVLMFDQGRFKVKVTI